MKYNRNCKYFSMEYVGNPGKVPACNKNGVLEAFDCADCQYGFVEFVPVAHAKWVFSHMLYDFVCSRCGAKPNYYVAQKDPFEDPDFRYCPYCGARMDEPETEEVSKGRDAT